VVETSRRHNEKQKHYEKGGEKLFELYLLIDETTVKGSKFFKPYLQVTENTVKGLKLFKPFCTIMDNFEA
jgi:hypothetical protein